MLVTSGSSSVTFVCTSCTPCSSSTSIPIRNGSTSNGLGEPPVGAFDLSRFSHPLELLERFDQIVRHVGSANLDAETLDQAARFDDGTAGFPEGTTLPRTRLGSTVSGKAERAVFRFRMAHACSVEPAPLTAIGRRADCARGLLRSTKRR